MKTTAVLLYTHSWNTDDKQSGMIGQLIMLQANLNGSPIGTRKLTYLCPASLQRRVAARHPVSATSVSIDKTQDTQQTGRCKHRETRQIARYLLHTSCLSHNWPVGITFIFLIKYLDHDIE